jgi:hypothetical protein
MDIFSPLLDSLPDLAKQNRSSYNKALPFKHAVFDNLIPDEVLGGVLEEFEQSDRSEWIGLDEEKVSDKKSIAPAHWLMGPMTNDLFGLFRTPQFIEFMEELTGIKGLLADPHMLGGGWHETLPGGMLELHTDFSWNPRVRLYRRLNILLYLNRDWKEEYNGHLELWDAGFQRQARILPTWNRFVVCNVTGQTVHGFPEPIRCPNGMTRKTIAFWLYTADIPDAMRDDYALRETNFIQRVGGRPVPLPNSWARRWLPPPPLQRLQQGQSLHPRLLSPRGTFPPRALDHTPHPAQHQETQELAEVQDFR